MRTRDQERQSRRHFLRQAACAKLGYFGLVNALAQMRLFNAAVAQNPPSDYKALVCLFLFGGNDGNNLLIPYSGPFRSQYVNARGVLSISTANLHQVHPQNDTANGWGFHPSLGQLASLFETGKLAVLHNVGTLSYPIADRTEFLSGTVPVPPQIFSHSDQQVQWQSSVPDRPFQTGWGGRLADLINAGSNPDSNVSMSISLSGINSFQVGTDVVQYAVTADGAIPLSGYGTDYTNALNPDGTYKNNQAGWRLKAFERIMAYTHANLMEEGYAQVMRRARDAEAVVAQADDSALASGVDFDAIFASADTPLGDQLKMIAKLVAGRTDLGNNRQVFFCSQGGYDTHQDQINSQVNLLTELGDAMAAFQAAIDALGLTDKVVLFTASDFTRTLTPNGNDANTAGSDHGWGGPAMVMGGPVVGQNLYGHFPNITPGGSADAGGSRGRWIPSTAVDQYGAVLARWFGVDSASMETIFPNLARFDDPFSVASANLNFLNLP